MPECVGHKLFLNRSNKSENVITANTMDKINDSWKAALLCVEVRITKNNNHNGMKFAISKKKKQVVKHNIELRTDQLILL